MAVQDVTRQFYDYVSEKIADLSSRVRLLEERYEQVRERGKATDQNLLRKSNELKEMIEELKVELDELHKAMKEMKETVKHLVKDMSITAKIQDLKVLEKYVDLFDPTRFITRKEAEELFVKKKSVTKSK